MGLVTLHAEAPLVRPPGVSDAAWAALAAMLAKNPLDRPTAAQVAAWSVTPDVVPAWATSADTPTAGAAPTTISVRRTDPVDSSVPFAPTVAAPSDSRQRGPIIAGAVAALLLLGGAVGGFMLLRGDNGEAAGVALAPSTTALAATTVPTPQPPTQPSPMLDRLVTSQGSVTLRPGESIGIQLAGAMTDGSAAPDALLRDVQWASSNPSIAWASPGGIVSATAPGQAVISATRDGVRALVNVLVIDGVTPPTTPPTTAPPRTAPPTTVRSGGGVATTAEPQPDIDPTELLTRYFLAAGARRYSEAWDLLTPRYQAKYGGFDRFVAFWDTVDIVGLDGADILDGPPDPVVVRADVWFKLRSGAATDEVVDVTLVDDAQRIDDYRVVSARDR